MCACVCVREGGGSTILYINSSTAYRMLENVGYMCIHVLCTIMQLMYFATEVVSLLLTEHVQEGLALSAAGLEHSSAEVVALVQEEDV